MHAPRTTYLAAMKCIFCYLIGTVDHGFRF